MSLCFLVTLCEAQTNNDPEAKKILHQLTEQIKNYASLKLNFSLKLETFNGKIKMVNEKKGNVWVKKEKYKVIIDKQEIFSNGIMVWNYDPRTNEVQITKPDPSNKTITPQSLVSSFYDDNFLYKLNPSVRIKKELYREIELTPIDKSKSFFKVYVYISDDGKGHYDIYQIKILEKNGNRYAYTLSKLVKNKKVEDAFFEFKKERFAGVEIVDLR